MTGGSLREVAALFLRLGTIAFGGPAAHIAMMRDEVVRRRRWVSDQQFLDLLGATNLIPGPNSTEMAIHLGYRRAGWAGLIVAGTCFILPAMAIVLALAWAYATYGQTPAAGWLLYGVKPVIIAIIVQALVELGRTALRTVLLGALAAGALALYLMGFNELLLLGAAAILTPLLRRPWRGRRAGLAGLAAWVAPWFAGRAAAAGAGVQGGPAGLTALVTLAAAPAGPAGPAAVSLTRMFAIFVKIGSVLYGGGYVLLAFLRADFVVRLGWLSERQLLDAIAVGQVTPGPVFTTATFIGYLLGGAPGAVLATVGIFLPAFVFVAATHPIIPRLRRSALAGAALDGVNAASLALMAGVTLQLGREALVDAWTVGLAAAAAAVLLLRPVNSAWLVAAGALAGLLLRR